MKTTFILVISILLAGNYLFASKEKIFNINGEDIKFISLESKKVLISATCVSKNKISKCEAATAIQKANIKETKPNNQGSNPGALVCVEQFKGEILMARDAKGNETSFCKFKDASILSTGTLGYYATLKK